MQCPFSKFRQTNGPTNNRRTGGIIIEQQHFKKKIPTSNNLSASSMMSHSTFLRLTSGGSCSSMYTNLFCMQSEIRAKGNPQIYKYVPKQELMWEFIKENKEVRKKENKLSTKKKRERSRKKEGRKWKMQIRIKHLASLFRFVQFGLIDK